MTRRQLDDLFETWLYTPAKPAGIETAPAPARAAASALLSTGAAGVLGARFPKS